jgi:hypothetical protein
LNFFATKPSKVSNMSQTVQSNKAINKK